MGLAYIVVALLSAAIAVFALQNNQPMSVRFLAWSVDNVPLAGAILAGLGAGLLLAIIPLSIGSWRWRSRARSLEHKVEMLEAALTSRDTALLTPRPVAPPSQITRSA
jgi:uncharacterized integral membrane protein